MRRFKKITELIEKSSKVREVKEKEKFKNLDERKYIRQKTERKIENPLTNKNTSQNEEESEQAPHKSKLKEIKNIIYFKCSHYLIYGEIKRIFKKYGKIINLRSKRWKFGWVIFSKKDSVQFAMREKQINKFIDFSLRAIIYF